MTKYYIDSELDTDTKVFFNLIGIPSIVYIAFNNTYYTFISMIIMFLVVIF